MISVLVADCPWQFSDKLGARGAEANYPTLSVAQLCVFPLPKLGNDAVCFFWRVSAMQEEALTVLRNWGFRPKSELVWLKQTVGGKDAFGMGRYTRMCHESCIIATRGSAMPKVHDQRSVFRAPVREHSAKPHEFYTLVERMYPDSPRYEMFARTVRPGWNQSGDELGKLGVNEDPRQTRMFEDGGKRG